MKKTALLITALLVASVFICALCGCNGKPDYYSYVSDLRKDIFVGENDLFGVVVWAGARENPYASDGVKNPTKLNLTIKVTQKSETGDKITAEIAYDEYRFVKELSFHPVKFAMASSFDVNVLPEKQMTVKLIYGDQSTELTLTSALNENTVAYSKALDSACNYCGDFIKRHTKKGKLEAEITVRLLAENGNNYYYVGFVGADGEKKSVLLDGENATVLADKDN